MNLFQEIANKIFFGLLLIISGILMILMGPYLHLSNYVTFGTATIILGAILLIYQNLKKKIDHGFFINNNLLKKIDDSINERKKISSITNSGISNIFRNETKVLQELDKSIDNAQSKVDILGVSYLTILRSDTIIKSIKFALGRGVKFRILLLSPKSTAFKNLKLKNDQLNAYQKNELKYASEKWLTFVETVSVYGRIEIRFYESFPITSIINIDNVFFITPNSDTFSTQPFPTIQLNKVNNSLFESYYSYFDVVWSTSTDTFWGENGQRNII